MPTAVEALYRRSGHSKGGTRKAARREGGAASRAEQKAAQKIADAHRKLKGERERKRKAVTEARMEEEEGGNSKEGRT